MPGLLDLSTDPRVIATNMLLALIALVCLLMATTMFNSTVKENSSAFDLPRLALPAVATLRAPVLPEGIAHLAVFIRPLALLAATAAIYAVLDPNFGWNNETVVVFAGLLGGLALTTFLFEGGQVLVSSRRFGIPAHMRLFPLALLIAVISVALTRITDFHPGVIFGFISSAIVLASGEDRRREGLIVWVPLACLLAMSVLALALVTPLRDWSAGRSDIWSKVPETIAVAVFVGGAQGVLLSLIPLSFHDGEKVWKWSKYAWFALALPASFLFFHTLVNTDESYEDLSSDTNALTMLAICGGFLAASSVFWLFFRLRSNSEAI